MTERYRLVTHRLDACVAFGEEGERTVGDLLADIGEVALALPPATPQSELLVICQDRYRFVAGVLAAWQAGHAVALPPNGQPETVHALAHAKGVRLVLHDIDGGEGLDLRTLLGKGREPVELVPIDPARHLATLYTSGSTGEHQACPKAASQLLGEALSHVGTFGLRPGTRFLATVPSHHIYGILYAVLAPLFCGGAFLRETPFHAETVAAHLARWRIDILVSVPAHLRGLEAVERLPRLDRTFSSGAPLPAATAAMLRERFGMGVTEVFGSSETGGIAWRDQPEAPWRPFPGVAVSRDQDGRLLLDSPFLAASMPRPYACADRIAPSANGSFELLGRLDGVVKVGGKRVALAELEQRLLSLEGVRDAAAVAVDVAGARGKEVWVAVATDRLTPDALRAALRRWFEPVALPRRIQVCDRLPREENGKITSRRLRALFEDPARSSRPSVKQLEPMGEERRTEEGVEVALLDFVIREDLFYFRGHFDGMPVLPGVLQLQGLVARQAARLWPDLTAVRKVRKLQFRKLIQPNHVVRLRLARPAGEARVDFEISRDGQTCSSGSLLYAS